MLHYQGILPQEDKPDKPGILPYEFIAWAYYYRKMCHITQAYYHRKSLLGHKSIKRPYKDMPHYVDILF